MNGSVRQVQSLELVKKFNRDEDGAVEPLHIVLAIAVGCVILAVVTAIFPDVRKWFEKTVRKILGFDS